MVGTLYWPLDVKLVGLVEGTMVPPTVGRTIGGTMVPPIEIDIVPPTVGKTIGGTDPKV